MENQQMGPRDVGFVLSEPQGNYAVDTVVIASGSGVLLPGTVLGKVSASGKFVKSPDAGADGSEVGVAILAYKTDATSADAEALAYVRICEVKKDYLLYDASVDTAGKVSTKNAELKAAGIIVR